MHKNPINKIIRQFAENPEKIVHINDFVVLETVNFLLRKGGFDTASAILKLFREHEQIEIILLTHLRHNELKTLSMEYINFQICSTSS